MTELGFEKSNAGKTSGSRIKYIDYKTGCIIKLHAPHQTYVDIVYLKFILETLGAAGYDLQR